MTLEVKERMITGNFREENEKLMSKVSSQLLEFCMNRVQIVGIVRENFASMKHKSLEHFNDIFVSSSQNIAIFQYSSNCCHNFVNAAQIIGTVERMFASMSLKLLG